MTDAEMIALAALVTAGRPAVETACRSFEALTGKPLEVAGAMLSDSLYRRRVRNLLAFLEEIAPRLQALRGQGIDLTPLSAEFGLPLLEAVETVEDPDLRKMWAQLLASGMEDERHQHPVFVHILRVLNSKDARVLIGIASEPDGSEYVPDGDPRWPSLYLLAAEGLIEPSEQPIVPVGGGPVSVRPNRRIMYPLFVSVSGLGRMFLDAVGAPPPPAGSESN